MKKFSVVDKEKLQKQMDKFKVLYDSLDRKHIRDIFNMWVYMNRLDPKLRWHVSYEFEGFTYILTRTPTFSGVKEVVGEINNPKENIIKKVKDLPKK